MKIAIHDTPGSYSDIWIRFCKENNLEYKIVNCYKYDIIEQLSDCNGLMWHWNQNDYKVALFAKQLTFSLEKMGIKVFPDTNTAWHHDDKVGQKYLMEAINAPFVDSYIFYNKQTALQWIRNVEFPIVFKLRGGASSVNVSLVNNAKQATRLIRKAFGKGFYHINRIKRLNDRFWTFKNQVNFHTFKGLVSGFVRLFIPTEVERFSNNHKGYIYFQEFIPGNDSDIRLVVVGNKCYGIVRYCREGDFRASGSGIKSFDQNLYNTECVKIAFDVAKKLNTQSVAFDFILKDNSYQILEISYCFVSSDFPGYWDSDIKWHEEQSCPQTEMIKNFIYSI